MSKSAERTTSSRSISSAVASRASPFPVLASEKAKPMNAGSGPSSTASFASLGRDGCWLKTSQGCCQLMLDGSLEEYCETWPRAGTMSNGTAYRRQPLAPRTSVTASFLWLTPTPIDAAPVTGGDLYQTASGTVRARYGRHSSNRGLATQVLWPTPRVGGVDGGANSRKAAKARGAWPTMTARDARTFKGTVPPPNHTGGLSLGQTIGDPQVSGALNPMWIEWLMGFPLGWTDLEPSATPSCPRSPNGSDGG